MLEIYHKSLYKAIDITDGSVHEYRNHLDKVQNEISGVIDRLSKELNMNHMITGGGWKRDIGVGSNPNDKQKPVSSGDITKIISCLNGVYVYTCKILNFNIDYLHFIANTHNVAQSHLRRAIKLVAHLVTKDPSRSKF